MTEEMNKLLANVSNGSAWTPIVTVRNVEVITNAVRAGRFISVRARFDPKEVTNVTQFLVKRNVKPLKPSELHIDKDGDLVFGGDNGHPPVGVERETSLAMLAILEVNLSEEAVSQMARDHQLRKANALSDAAWHLAHPSSFVVGDRVAIYEPLRGTIVTPMQNEYGIVVRLLEEPITPKAFALDDYTNSRYTERYDMEILTYCQDGAMRTFYVDSRRMVHHDGD